MTVTDPEAHGTRALIQQHIYDEPAVSNGRVVRQYGRQMMRELAADCEQCREADEQHERLHLMHSAYASRRS